LQKHTIEYSEVYPDKTLTKFTTRPGDSHARQVRCVCGQCNNGWMKGVVDAVEPHLIDGIKGKSFILNRKQQKALAAWAAMTVMTGEFIEKAMVAIPQADRTFLMENLVPPRQWRIWISRYTPGLNVRQWTHHAVALEIEGKEDAAFYEPSPPNTQSSTICVGEHLFFYVMSSEIAQTIVRRWNFPPSIKPLLSQIWPASAATVRWPPGRALTSIETNYVADEFFRRVDQKLARDLAAKGGFAR
jgi:hypothetical protein